jgi:electron transport complex protein RnfG
MTDQAEVQPQALPATPSGAMLRTLGAVASISGFLVVLAYQLTLPLIEENQRIAIENAIFQVVPGAVTRHDFLLGPQGLSAEGEGERIYAAYDQAGKLKGVALQGAAQGYQDVIKLLYGFDPSCQCITGIKILKMTETPGLGDKIAKDASFQANFKALDATLNGAGAALEHPVVTVKHGTKQNPWEIDAISGATISSNAVGRALNESAQRIVPLIMRNLATLEAPQPEAVGATD